jgi:Interferon-related developmental regulator (IFRD)
MAKKTRNRKAIDATIEEDILPEDHTIVDSIAASIDFEDDVSIEDLLSTGGGHNTSSENAHTRHTKALDVLSEIDDWILEKRSSKREAGLRRLFRAIVQYSDSETLAPFEETLLQFCMSSLRNGSAAEQYAACRCLEAQAVVLGSDRDDYFEAVEPNLKRVVMMTARASMVRAAALRALSVANFICSTDDVSTDALLDLTEDVAGTTYRQQNVPASLRATALDCWALLATTVQEFYISGGDEDTTGRGLSLLPLLLSCLHDSSSMELRSAAGQSMALIHEFRLSLGDEDGETTTERKYGKGGWDGSFYEDVVYEIQQRVTELSNQSGHSISKKAKKEQRSAFRDFLNTIVDNESPKDTVLFRGGSLELTCWKDIVQLQFIRHCLQGGFQIQILTNPTLQTVFGADGAVLNGPGTMSQLEKRLFLSKTSEAARLAYVDLTKKRRMRNNVKNHFITTDGEDI